MKIVVCMLIALIAMSVAPALADIPIGDPGNCRVINVVSGGPVTLSGSPWNPTFYDFAWSTPDFTLAKDHVILTSDQLSAESIAFDAPIEAGEYTVTLLIQQDGYIETCIDTYCVKIVVTEPKCFTTDPFCEEDTNPKYCWDGAASLGNTYAWTTNPNIGTGTEKCFTFPEIDVPSANAYADYVVTLVVTDLDGEKTCTATQRVLAVPEAVIV